MRPPSRRQLARAFINLCETGPRKRAVQALAVALFASRRRGEADLVMQSAAQELWYARRHLSGRVTSARRLTPAHQDKISDALQKKTGARTAQLSFQTNLSLLGGIVADLPTGRLDLSLQSRLALLAEQ